MIKSILFQGDSITDAGRSRDKACVNEALGCGYVSLVAGQLLLENPTLKIRNRGIGGNRSGDVYARFKEDAVNVEFDLFSLLLGVNDVGFGIRLGSGSTLEEFRFIYDHMLDMVKKSHPDARIVLCQPFVLPVDHDWPPYGNDIYRDYARWEAEVTARGEIVRELAEKWGALFVPMFDALKEAMKKVPASALSSDGVHPNTAGSAVIADAWLKTVKGAGWL